jgi:hypothetical protein
MKSHLELEYTKVLEDIKQKYLRILINLKTSTSKKRKAKIDIVLKIQPKITDKLQTANIDSGQINLSTKS